MYLKKFAVRNIRSVGNLDMEFDRDREAGWHVVLGPNGSGKSSMVRAFALLMMGEKEAYAARQIFKTWVGKEDETATVSGVISWDERFDALVGGGQPPKRAITPTVTLKPEEYDTGVYEPQFSGDLVTRTIWGGGEGWFSASFGPYRRFTGGDRVYDKLFISNRRLAPHLSSLGEDVALTEALEFLSSMLSEALQSKESNKQASDRAFRKLGKVMAFVNNSGLLPHGTKIQGIAASKVFIEDGRGAVVTIDQLSDGYRSVLSLVIELIRQMFNLYGEERMLSAFSANDDTINAPGVVVIDEIDAHLHPDWQRDIGTWLVKSFPKIQFLVTTHSPILCRAVVNPDGEITGSVWRLPTPGTNETFRRVKGTELDMLAFGDLLDAYDTQLFGEGVARSAAGDEKIQRLAELNLAALERDLTDREAAERRRLRGMFPSHTGISA